MASAAFSPTLLSGLVLLLCAIRASCQADFWSDDPELSWDIDDNARSVAAVWMAVCCIVTGYFLFSGLIVALQWPTPRFLCYRTPMSDLPTIRHQARRFLSVYSINIACLVFWAVIFCVMVLSPTTPQVPVAACYLVGHMGVVVLFRAKFKRHGLPSYLTQEAELTSQSYGSQAAVNAEAGRNSPSVMGMPVYNIPMATVVVGTEATQGACQEAACCPPGALPGPYMPQPFYYMPGPAGMQYGQHLMGVPDAAAYGYNAASPAGGPALPRAASAYGTNAATPVGGPAVAMQAPAEQYQHQHQHASAYPPNANNAGYSAESSAYAGHTLQPVPQQHQQLDVNLNQPTASAADVAGTGAAEVLPPAYMGYTLQHADTERL